MKYFVRCIKATKRNPNDKNFTVGKVYEVTEKGIVDDTGFKYISYTYGEENNIYALNKWFCSCGYKFELVNAEKIVITHDGKTTTATLYRGDEKVVATARCAPEDKFDFTVGAKLAMERLNAEVNKPKYYNGKVVCIKADTGHWTVGKVYEVKDGIVRSNYDMVHPRFNETPYRDEADIRHIGSEPWNDCRHNPRNEFVPLIED